MPVRWIDEVLAIALQYQPVPREPILIDSPEKLKNESNKKTRARVTAH